MLVRVVAAFAGTLQTASLLIYTEGSNVSLWRNELKQSVPEHTSNQMFFHVFSASHYFYFKLFFSNLVVIFSVDL